jgi:hypothetical protein
MSFNLKDYETDFAIGIRFRANFHIEDKLGEIIDSILYKNKDSFFSSKTFPEVESRNSAKILWGEIVDKGSKQLRKGCLRIDHSNIILEYESTHFEEAVNSFNEAIIKGIVEEYEVIQIQRIGILHKYEIKNSDQCDSLLKNVVGTKENVGDMSFRFSKKIPAAKALIKAGVSDYSNEIYSIGKQLESQSVVASYDFQKYFSPPTEKGNDIGFNKLRSEAANYLNDNFTSWVEGYLK